MKRMIILSACLLLSCLAAEAQQIMYSNLKKLLSQDGDTVSTLLVERRNNYTINLMNGGDFRIGSSENSGLNRYLRSRCYAVRIDSVLYFNCRKMRYMRYRFGVCYAPGLQVGNRYFFSAQPLGQVASRTFAQKGNPKLGGEVGDAIDVSGLIRDRVYYEINPETGKSDFVGIDYLKSQFKDQPLILRELEKEKNESAEVILKYIKQLQ